MNDIAPRGHGVKPAYPQREMEQAARRFMAAVGRVIDLSQASRLVLDGTRIVAEFTDSSIGVIGTVEARS
jgi:hypothetical protein